MRKPQLAWPDSEALALLRSAPIVHLASCSPEGPILRTMHAVLVGNLLAFHSGRAGEKGLMLGQPAVASAERVLSQIPSYFVHPEKACPATTYYESVQVKGPLEEVKDLSEKALILESLMQKYQSEGGYVPLTSESALYRKDLRGLLVYGVRIKEVTGKRKVGQNRKPEEIARIVSAMWERGEHRDLAMIDALVRERLGESLPSWLQGPRGTRLRCQLGPAERVQVVALLRDTYWNTEVDDQQIAAVHDKSLAWVGCVDEGGRVIGSARAVTDGVKFGWIMDVVVAPEAREAGIGRALMELLLGHPMLRHCHRVGLATQDGQGFYRKLGFEVWEATQDVGSSQQMLLSARRHGA